MATNILSIGQSALAAAQIGISVTGHNIANASTLGYSRQVVVQGAAPAQNFGFGYLGSGVDVNNVQRMYSDFQAAQVRSSQTIQSGFSSYYTQISQIDNMLANTTSGLSPTLQNFFKGIQGLSADPTSAASRQASLSSANTLASRFQGMGAQLDQMGQGVNTQITSSVGTINSLSTQIAQLNQSIVLAQGATAAGQPPNDLMDQRDQLVMDLSKQIKATVVKQYDGQYNVFIGNGQPLVVGGQTYQLSTAISPTDPSRTEVAYKSINGTTAILSGSTLTGGALGGLLDFRNQSLDPAKNALGRVAIGLATTFNAQHRLGQDLNGNPGGDFFAVGTPTVAASTNNTGTATLTASISNVSALTTSDYTVNYNGTGYQVTRMSDGVVTPLTTSPQTIDGVDFTTAGVPATGDSFLVRPTVNGAPAFAVKITDPSLIAAAAPIITAAPTTNTGSGQISAGSVDASYLSAPLAAPVTLTYAAGQLTGFPATQAVTVTNGGTSTTYPAGSPVPFTAGATISFGGMSMVISGTPANADTFTVGPNTGGIGDNRNALLLGALQTTNTLVGGTANYQDAFAQLVATVGNKTNELKVTSDAETQTLSNLTQAQQSLSGVNLDEEASNLLRYQQAYQAAGKVMQIASQLFSTLLTIGG
ncbi:MAG: flagellar hook-associated protein FlgK [Sulfuriferula sp.]